MSDPIGHNHRADDDQYHDDYYYAHDDRRDDDYYVGDDEYSGFYKASETFAIFFGYIFFFILITFLIDKSRILEDRVHNLTMKSQTNLHPWILKNSDVSEAESETRNTVEAKNRVGGECCDSVCCGAVKAVEQMKDYKVEYLHALVDRPAYLATAEPTTPIGDGFKVSWGSSGSLQFPPGFFVSSHSINVHHCFIF
jgi:hypothetical protein